MKTKITKREFQFAEKKMNELLAVVTKKGGFDYLTKKENVELNKYTQVVKIYEDQYTSTVKTKAIQDLKEAFGDIKLYEQGKKN